MDHLPSMVLETTTAVQLPLMILKRHLLNSTVATEPTFALAFQGCVLSLYLEYRLYLLNGLHE